MFDVLYVVVDCVPIFGEQIPRDLMATLRLTQFLLRLVRLTRLGTDMVMISFFLVRTITYDFCVLLSF